MRKKVYARKRKTAKDGRKGKEEGKELDVSHKRLRKALGAKK